MKEQIKDAMDQLLAIAGGEATFSEVRINATSAKGSRYQLDISWENTDAGVKFKAYYVWPSPLPEYLKKKIEAMKFDTAEEAFRTAIDKVEAIEAMCDTL